MLRDAVPADLPAVLGLLGAVELPAAGVAEHVSGFVVAAEGGALVGVAGLESHGRDGLLRSVAVVRDRRGSGLGGRLTRRVVEAARAAGLRRLYLLTTTAEDYFPRHGFRRIDRRDVSAEVQESVEFREVCADSAVAMVLDLEEVR